jgi:hypothetical protein
VLLSNKWAEIVLEPGDPWKLETEEDWKSSRRVTEPVQRRDGGFLFRCFFPAGSFARSLARRTGGPGRLLKMARVLGDGGAHGQKRTFVQLSSEQGGWLCQVRNFQTRSYGETRQRDSRRASPYLYGRAPSSVALLGQPTVYEDSGRRGRRGNSSGSPVVIPAAIKTGEPRLS